MKVKNDFKISVYILKTFTQSKSKSNASKVGLYLDKTNTMSSWVEMDLGLIKFRLSQDELSLC